MKIIKYKLLILLFPLLLTSCNGNKEISTEGNLPDLQTTSQPESRNIDIALIREKLCQDFPKDLVLKYNTDGTKIEIEPIDDGSGGILNCKVKLFYGEKDYEFWEGQVSAWVNKVENPFWQYNLERNATLYHKIEGFGEKAVYISNMSQLQILKDDIMYSIVPPNRGRTTNTGKENKDIAIEIAEHYNI